MTKKQKKVSKATKREPFTIIFGVEADTHLETVQKTIKNFSNNLDNEDQIIILSDVIQKAEDLEVDSISSDSQKISCFNSSNNNDFLQDIKNNQIIFVADKNLTNELTLNEILHQKIQVDDGIVHLNYSTTGLLYDKAPVLAFNRTVIDNHLDLFAKSINIHHILLFLIDRNDWNVQSRILPKTATVKFNSKMNLSKWIRSFKLWYSWLITEPIHEIFTRKKISFDNNAPIFRLAFLLIAITSLAFMLIFSKDAGISGDEPVNYEHAEYVYDYYAEGDSTALHTPQTKLQYYGQSFDNLTYIYNHITESENPYRTRHFFNSLTGWLAMLFTGILAVYLMGWRAGALAFILIVFSPRFLGHSWNNPKDIPFAFTYIFCLFYQIKLLAELPKLKQSTLFTLAFAIGLSISVRIGGLLLIIYQFMFLAIYAVAVRPYKNTAKPFNSFINTGFQMLGISIAGYFLGLVLWPYALEDPINHPFESLEMMTHFSTTLRQAFMGDVIWSDRAPWYYTPIYILFTTPIIILVGMVIFAVLVWKHPRKKLFLNLFVAFAFAFPIFYIIYRGSNVYGGWRHVLFSFPALIVIASVGLNDLINRFKPKLQPFLLGTVISLLAFPIYHTFKNHPYQYVYFNQFVGGVNGAYGDYEMDYYYHSLKETTEWVVENKLNEASEEDRLIVASNHSSLSINFIRNHHDKISMPYVRYYERGNSDWDYAVIANSYISPYQQEKGYWPPANTVYEVKVGDAVIGAVIERKDRNDLYGYEALRDGNYAKAIDHFKKALETDPNNEVVRINLAKIYVEQNRLDEAQQIIQKTLQIYKDYDKALNLLGMVYMKKREFDNALGTYNYLLKINPKYVTAYHNIGIVLLNQQKLDQALTYFQRAIDANPRYKPSYMAIAHVLRQQGRNEEAQRVMQAAQRIP